VCIPVCDFVYQVSMPQQKNITTKKFNFTQKKDG